MTDGFAHPTGRNPKTAEVAELLGGYAPAVDCVHR